LVISRPCVHVIDTIPSGEPVSSGIVGVTVEVKNHVWGEHATEFIATGTAVRRLAAEHKLPETTPKPTFTLGLDD
jgi:hypothetical protein